MEPTERPGGRTGVDDQGTIAMTLPELTLRYLADPDPRTLRKLREHVRAAPSFDRYAVIPTPSQRITADEALQVVTDIVDRMPGWFLSPEPMRDSRLPMRNWATTNEPSRSPY